MCVADGDPALFLTVSTVRARREHVCEECDHRVQKGEAYTRITGLWERGDRPVRFVHCTACRELAEAVEDADCSWLIGSLLDDAQTTLTSYDHLDAPAEALGTVAGTLFRIRERREDARVRT